MKIISQSRCEVVDFDNVNLSVVTNCVDSKKFDIIACSDCSFKDYIVLGTYTDRDFCLGLIIDITRLNCMGVDYICMSENRINVIVGEMVDGKLMEEFSSSFMKNKLL